VLQGLYKWSWASANGQGEGSGLCNTKYDIYMDEFKFGNAKATLESISPGGTPPAPQPSSLPKFVDSGCKVVTCPAVAIPDRTITKLTDTFAIYATHTTTTGTNYIRTFDIVILNGPNKPVTKASQSGYVPTTMKLGITGLAVGAYQLQIKATDYLGGSVTDTMLLTVRPASQPNRAPVVNAGPDQQVVVNAAQMNGTATDPDGDAMTYQWEVVAGTGLFSSSTILRPTVSGMSAGVNTYKLTATDSKGLSTSSQMTVRYSPPVPSVVFIQDVKVENKSIDGALRIVVTITYTDGTTQTIQSK
jgi:hypothetical protein